MQGSKQGIGTRIKSARQAKEMTQAELARAIGRTRSLVNVWEPGKSKPSVEDLKAVAKTLGVSLEWLATGDAAAPYFGRPPVDLPTFEVPISEIYRVLEHLARQVDHIRQTVDRLVDERQKSGKD